MKLIGVRLPPDLLKGVDRYLEELRRERPGSGASRSDAIRELVYRGLKALRLA